MNAHAADPSSLSGQSIANPRRKKALIDLAVVVLVVVVVVAWAAHDSVVTSHCESTENAYLQGNVTQITPQITSTIRAILADDIDFVKAAQPLVQPNPADARVAFDQA